MVMTGNQPARPSSVTPPDRQTPAPQADQGGGMDPQMLQVLLALLTLMQGGQGQGLPPVSGSETPAAPMPMMPGVPGAQ